MGSSRALTSFLLRVDRQLHERLKEAARRRGLSLNEYCQETLRSELSIEERSPKDPLLNAIVQSFSERGIEGIVLFGSAARSELGARSDIDLLIALRSPVERSLYRIWDDSPEIQSAVRDWSHPVNPQFARLPDTASRAGGIWLEASLEGKILWDPSSQIHLLMVAIRKAMLAGKYERSVSHGHPYWIRKEAS